MVKITGDHQQMKNSDGFRPRPFSENQKVTDIWIDSLNCNKFVFIPCPSREPPKFIKTRCWPLTLISYKAFFKTRGLKLVSMPLFCMISEEEYFSCYIQRYILTDQISLSDCLYFLIYLSICLSQLFGTKYPNKICGKRPLKIWRGMVCLSIPFVSQFVTS